MDETRRGPSRRQILRGAALTGGVVWTAPVVQAIAPSASAATSIPCVGCLTGGGQILGGICKNAKPAAKISFGLGPICCPTHDPTEIEVNCHPAGKDARSAQKYHFDVNDQVTCRKTGNPAPPPQTQPCANLYRGTVNDKYGNTLLFEFVDNGEPGKNDSVRITITDSTGNTLVEGAASLDRGNLQVHPSLGPMKVDCLC
ncbi:MAG: hypothetical protein LH477_08695 [Nocardioides sp.]|nr:hypothetical protein [Nocardioides sp.]